MRNSLVVLFSFIVASGAVGASMYDCRVYEYVELKDMNTRELLSKGGLYHHSAAFLKKLVANSRQNSNPLMSKKEAQDEEDALERCSAETSRIVGLLRKRKDIAQVLKSNGLKPLFYEEFANEFNFPR